MKFLSSLLLLFCLSVPLVSQEAPLRETVALDAKEWPADWRMHVEFSTSLGGRLEWPSGFSLELLGKNHDVAMEFPENKPPVLRVWTDGKLAKGPEEVAGLAQSVARDYPEANLDWGTDFTAYARFTTKDGGTLLAKCAPEGKWSADAKALYIKDGKLIYDIGWLGALGGGSKVDDGKEHTVVLTVDGGKATLWLDGKEIASEEDFFKPDVKGHVMKIGRASPDFGGDFKGDLGDVRFWKRTMDQKEVATLFKEGVKGANTPDFQVQPLAGGRPVVKAAEGGNVVTGWVQALERTDHSELVASLNADSLAEGKVIYEQLCMVCHGTLDKPGSLPTALRFSEGVYKNGSDPYAQYLTLTKGFGQMVPQPQYTTKQKYAVIQYIRETFLKEKNPGQYVEVTPGYLQRLPKGKTLAEEEKVNRTPPPYEQMEMGPALFWTLQIEKNNVARKGIAIRLDEGPGGVTKGKAWMIYDHDTMRLAAATTGGFVDWKGIAFDGSHGTHTSLSGERHVVLPPGPGWASPDNSWEEVREKGRDDLPFGPLPADWVQYKGLYVHGGKAVISMTVGGAAVWESPGWIDYGTTPVFTRTINVGKTERVSKLRVAPDSLNVILRGDGTLEKADGFWIASLPSLGKAKLFISKVDAGSLEALAKQNTEPLDLEPLTKGGPAQWTGEVTTTVETMDAGGPFAVENLPLPVANPWYGWMRPGGFDFTEDGTAAIVAMWNGDVWRVDGLTNAAPAVLRWKRMASGLFQPLGVKFRNNELFLTCRDQLVKLVDLNGDGETDFYECFNNDHQVTEHFHEFAMGLQTDEKGRFYYAKSARHALPALVPHHGTLLRVSEDGKKTEILATGFRAANGVCLNEDGSFFVTDQEGHWTPKNRINRVKEGGFYGNLFGYTDVTDPSDDAMEPPMVWITNAKDRSPAELLWVPPGAWRGLDKTLLNLSYGTGKVFSVPHEEINGVWQGAVCELPMPELPSGVMRGRFAADGSLYAVGMFAWAGSATAPGGFYRIKRTEAPAHVPVAIHARKDVMEIVLSDAIDPAGVDKAACHFKTWSLERSAKYGSGHVNEREIDITKVAVDGKTIRFTIPGLQPTMCYELAIVAKDGAGKPLERILHGTIHSVK